MPISFFPQNHIETLSMIDGIAQGKFQNSYTSGPSERFHQPSGKRHLAYSESEAAPKKIGEGGLFPACPNPALSGQ